MKNPYLEDCLALGQNPRRWYADGFKMFDHDPPRDYRTERVAKYAWAIPDDRAINIVAKYAPIVEMGAGTGYWAWLLRQRGVDVLAFDRFPPRDPRDTRRPVTIHQQRGLAWTEVLYGTPKLLRRYPAHALFLCWPPYHQPMASECLRHYQGDILIYIGEGDGGCTADAKFHNAIEDEKLWTEIESCQIQHWEMVHDYLRVFRRAR